MKTRLMEVSEGDDLDRLESVIKRGQKSFVKVGKALAEIRYKRLYRQAYKTFADYCEHKWGWTRRRADYMIESASVAKSENICSQIGNEAQAREIAKVEPEKRETVLDIAAQSGPVTAKKIKEAARQVEETEEPDEPETPHIQTADEETAPDHYAEFMRQLGLISKTADWRDMAATFRKLNDDDMENAIYQIKNYLK